MATEIAAAPLTPKVGIRVNGSDLSLEAAADVISVEVSEDLGTPTMFTVTLANWDMSQLTTKWSDDDLWQEGGEVEIVMGYTDQQETMVVGEITGLEPEFVTGEPPIVTVRGHDRLHRLLRGRKTRSFLNLKDSDIASQIASDLGLIPEAEDTGVTFEYVLQRNQTDFDFLGERARRIGYLMSVDDKTLYYRPHQLSGQEALTLVWENNLISFSPRMSTLSQVGQISVRGWDPKEKAEIVGQSQSGDESSTMEGEFSGPSATDTAFGQVESVRVDWPVASQAEADQIALGRFNVMALSYVSGDGTCDGMTGLRAGAMIRIDGLGQRFSGLYYVTSTNHTFTAIRGYRTAFTARRNAT